MFVRCHLLERNKSLEDSFLQDAILHQIMNTFCLTFSTARSLSHGGITLTLLFAANEELSAGHFCNLTRFDHDELRQIWNAIHNTVNSQFKARAIIKTRSSEVGLNSSWAIIRVRAIISTSIYLLTK